MTKLNFTRGKRDYLRAADLLKVAPLPSDLLRFEMRFLALGHHAGEWVLSNSTEMLATSVARLVVLRPQGPETWAFVPHAAVTGLQQIEDLNEAEIVAPGVLRDGRYHCTLTDHAGLWDQLIAQIRLGGEQVISGRRWYVVSVTVTRWPLGHSIASRSLTIAIRRQKQLYIELSLDLDDMPFGKVLLRQAAEGAERA